MEILKDVSREKLVVVVTHNEELAKKYDLEYLAIDFKKKDGFLKTNKISRELNLYRQNYCGCKFSMREL